MKSIKSIYNELQALPDNEKTPEIKRIIKSLAFKMLKAKKDHNNGVQTNWDGTQTDFNAIK